MIVLKGTTRVREGNMRKPKYAPPCYLRPTGLETVNSRALALVPDDRRHIVKAYCLNGGEEVINID